MTTPTTGTTDAATSYAALAQKVQDVVDGVTHWAAPSPCEGWSAADVVAHLIDTERDFLAQRDVPLPAAPDVAADPAGAWREHAAAVGALLADPAVSDAQYEGFFGPTTVGESFVRFYGFDLIVHRWDIGRASGRDVPFTDSELDTIEASTAGFGEHLYDDGICKPGVAVPADADRTTRVLATLGREA